MHYGSSDNLVSDHLGVAIRPTLKASQAIRNPRSVPHLVVVVLATQWQKEVARLVQVDTPKMFAVRVVSLCGLITLLTMYMFAFHGRNSNVEVLHHATDLIPESDSKMTSNRMSFGRHMESILEDEETRVRQDYAVACAAADLSANTWKFLDAEEKAKVQNASVDQRVIIQNPQVHGEYGERHTKTGKIPEQALHQQRQLAKQPQCDAACHQANSAAEVDPKLKHEAKQQELQRTGAETWVQQVQKHQQVQSSPKTPSVPSSSAKCVAASFISIGS